MLSLLLGTLLCLSPVRADVRLDSGWERAQVASVESRVPEIGWTSTAVPHVEFVPAPGPRTSIWYRRTVRLEPNSRTILRFESAHKATTVFVDGEPIDRWLDSWSPHEVDITDAAAGRESVQIAVQCADKAEFYADGFLPPAGSPESALEGKVLWPLGGYKDTVGLALPVWQLTRPVECLADESLRVITSVRAGTLELRGQTIGGRRVSAAAVDRDGSRLELGSVPVAEDGTWSLTSPVAEPKLWSPEDPHLYTLELSLLDASGDVLDRSMSRFGFREVWVEGPRFYLNGVRRNLLATSTWPLVDPLPREEVERRLRAVKDSNAIAFRLHIGPWQKEFREVADEIGLMIVEEGPLYTDGSGMYAYRDERFWRNYEQVLEGLIAWSFNHPSVVLWSLGNEILFMGNGSRDPDLPRKLGDLARFARTVDPTRPMTFEADLDPDGAYDVIGLHYPHELPNQHAYPIAADWLAERKDTEAGGGMLGTTGSSFYWNREKPLYIGEYLWVPYGDYSPGTVFFGPEAYLNRGRYNAKARHLSWFDQTVAYRRAGVTGLCPWTAFGFGASTENAEGIAMQKSFYAPIAAIPRFRDVRAFSNAKVDFEFDVFNETPESLAITVCMKVDGLGKQTIPVELRPGEKTTASFQFSMPDVRQYTTIQAVSWVEAKGQELDPRWFTVAAVPPMDGWPQNFRRIDRLEDLEGISEIPTFPTVLVIAAGLLDAKPVEGAEGLPTIGSRSFDPAGLKDWVKRGGRAIILEHESLSALDLPIETVRHVSTMAFSDHWGMPSLKFWGADKVVSRTQILRTGRGGVVSLATTGGPRSMAQAPIAMMRFGKGIFGFVQVLADEKSANEPSADRTVLAVESAFPSSRPAVDGPVVVVGGEPALWDRLHAIDLDVIPVPERTPDGPISGVILAGGEVPDWLLRRFARPELPVLWFADSQTYPVYAEAVGFGDRRFVPGEFTLGALDHISAFPGLTAEELTWTTQPTGWDRQTLPLTAICTGAILPPPPSGATTVLTEFDAPAAVEDEGGWILSRKTPATAKLESRQGGLRKLTIIADPVRNPIIRVDVNGVRQAWLAPSNSRSVTWVFVGAGTYNISVSIENAADYGDSGPQLRLRALEVGPPQAHDGRHRTFSHAGTLVGSDTRYVTTLRQDALAGNAVKAERLLGALCANLGMRFRFAEGAVGESLPLDRFTVESGPYNSARADVLEMRSNGTAVTEMFVATPGEYQVVVDAESSPASGEYAAFSVEVDGKPAGQGQCAGAQLGTYALQRFRMEPGRRTLRFAFTNDAGANGEDRNLFVRRIAIVRLGN